MKPPIAARVNVSHRLAHSLVGCWLLNEGAGRSVRDISGHSRHGSFSGGPVWVPGQVGHAVAFDGYDDWVSMGDCLDLGTDDLTLLSIFSFSAAEQPETWNNTHFGAIAGKGYLGSSNKGYGMYVADNRIIWQVRNQSLNRFVGSDNTLNDGRCHVGVGVCDRDSATGMRLYIDGIRQIDVGDPTALDGMNLNGSQAFAVGSRQDESGTWAWDFLGTVAAVYVWKRVLADTEILELQRDPFAPFARRGPLLCGHTQTGEVVELAGSASSQSAVAGVLGVTRHLAGASGGASALSATLTKSGQVSLAGAIQCASAIAGSLNVSATQPAPNDTLEIETAWRREALFFGMTATAFQLGTALTQGWFWVRPKGCQVVYRGPSIHEIDFRHILHVIETGQTQFCLPTWVPHAPGPTYCYLVQRFNGCGQHEQTTGAAVAVHIDPDGQLADPMPHPVSGLTVEQLDGTTLRLTWFYSPTDQTAPPDRFNLYWDGGTGCIDLQNPAAVIDYAGCTFYCHEHTVPAEGTYAFLVRTQSPAGIESMPSLRTTCQVKAVLTPAPTVIAAEPV